MGNYKTGSAKKSVLYMAPCIYNNILKILKELPLIKPKKQLTEFLIDKCYYSLFEFLI